MSNEMTSIDDDNYFVSNEVKCNRVSAKDGSYYAKWLQHTSDSKVIVSGGLIDTRSLMKCAREILFQSQYHGQYLENVEFDNGWMNLWIGS